MKTLTGFLSNVKVIETRDFQGLSAVCVGMEKEPGLSAAEMDGPSCAHGNGSEKYIPLSAGIMTGSTVVSEAGGGSVERLHVHNRGGDYLFGMVGELVKGGFQDRVLAGSVLIAPGAGVEIPVCCVEEGRWSGFGFGSGSGSGFGSGRSRFAPTEMAAPASVRSAILTCENSTMHGYSNAHEYLDEYEYSRNPAADVQTRVWQAVGQTLVLTNTASSNPTKTLVGGMSRMKHHLDDYVEALSPSNGRNGKNILGMGLFSGGANGFAGLDLFGCADLFEHYSKSLLRGAAMNVETNGRKAVNGGSRGLTQTILDMISAAEPDKILNARGGVPGALEFVYNLSKLSATALCHENSLVHLAVVPEDGFSADVHCASSREKENHAIFRVSAEDDPPRMVRLKDGAHTIGRSTSTDIQIMHERISRRHALLEISSRGVSVRDLGSSNGTFVNGENVIYSQVRPGDEILLAGVVGFLLT